MSQLDSDTIYSSTAFHNFFEHSPRSLVLKANAPHFTILAVSDTYLSLVHRQRSDLLGLGLFEAFPGSEGDPTEKNSVYSSFFRVIESREPDELPIFKYEIVTDGTGLKETHYWTNLNEPVLNEEGHVSHIINTTTNITEHIQLEQAVEESKKRERSLNDDLAASNEELMAINEELIASVEELNEAQYELQLLNKELTVRTAQLAESELHIRNLIQASPVALLVTRGAAMIFEEFNQAMLDMIGKDDSIKGKPWFEAIPELKGQAVLNDLYQTYHTGEELQLEEVAITMNRNGKPYPGYYSIHYKPLIENGIITGVLQSVVETTLEIKARRNVEQLNKELTVINEELNSLRYDAEQAEHGLRVAIDAANFGTWHIHPVTRRMTTNNRMKELFGFNADEEPTLEDYTEQVTEDLRALVTSGIDRAVENGETYDMIYTVNDKQSNNLKWIRAIGNMKADRNGELNTFTGVALDITEQKTEEQRKSDFIGMVSHELKTPLTTVNGYLQILKSRSKNADDHLSVSMFEKTGQQVRKMTSMINGFLNVSRLESGKIHINLRHFDLALLVRETEEELISTITSHQIVFAPVVETWVHADRDKIAHVISNLISNAVKYSKAGSMINIACVTKADIALFSVQDQGMGIRPEDLPKLFERYYRVKEVQATTIAGFGIGLYLCHEIIKRHNGKIWVESEPGKGSTFYFSLPVIS